MTKEEIYDGQISPLMRQIIKICNEHQIANLCSFALDDEDGNRLTCTTLMATEEYDPPESFKEAFALIEPNRVPSPMMVTVVKDDGSKKITAVF